MSSAPALDVQAAVRMLEEQAAGVGKLDLSEEDLADLEVTWSPMFHSRSAVL